MRESPEAKVFPQSDFLSPTSWLLVAYNNLRIPEYYLPPSWVTGILLEPLPLSWRAWCVVVSADCKWVLQSVFVRLWSSRLCQPTIFFESREWAVGALLLQGSQADDQTSAIDKEILKLVGLRKGELTARVYPVTSSYLLRSSCAIFCAPVVRGPMLHIHDRAMPFFPSHPKSNASLPKPQYLCNES